MFVICIKDLQTFLLSENEAQTHPLHILFLSKRNRSINTMLAFLVLRFTLLTWKHTHTHHFLLVLLFVFIILFRKCTFSQCYDEDEDDDVVPWLARRGISSVYTTHTAPLWLRKVLKEDTHTEAWLYVEMIKHWLVKAWLRHHTFRRDQILVSATYCGREWKQQVDFSVKWQ